MDAKRSGDYLEKTMCRKILYTSRIWALAVRHVLEQFLKMRIPEDGGGVESQRV
jgi:hypothetical protein